MLEGIVQRGRRPWLPNQGVTALDVWHADDVPTLGTFDLEETTVLFTAVGDLSTSSTTVWAYLPLGSETRALVADAEFDSAGEMQEFAESLFCNSHALFACADDFVLNQWGTEPVGAGPTAFLAAVIAFLEQVSTQLKDELADREGDQAARAASRTARRVIREQKREVSEIVARHPEFA